MPTGCHLHCFQPSVSVACGGSAEFTRSSVSWPTAFRLPDPPSPPHPILFQTLTIFPGDWAKNCWDQRVPGSCYWPLRGLQGSRAWPQVLAGSALPSAPLPGVCEGKGRWERKEGGWSPSFGTVCPTQPLQALAGAEQGWALARENTRSPSYLHTPYSPISFRPRVLQWLL